MILSLGIVVRHVLPGPSVGPKRLVLPLASPLDVRRKGKPIGSIDLANKAKPVAGSNHAVIGNAVVNVSTDPLIAPMAHPNGTARAISHTGSTAMARKFFVTARVAMSSFNRQLVRL
jgi:hypothetical protein